MGNERFLHFKRCTFAKPRLLLNIACSVFERVNMKDPLITMDEVSKHTSRDDCWTVIHGKVYDITNFLNKHPGGTQVLLKYAGKDSTLQFDDIGHSLESLAYDLDPGALKGTLYQPKSKSHRIGDNDNDEENNDEVQLPFFLTTIFPAAGIFWLTEACQAIKKFLVLERDTRIRLLSVTIFFCVLTLGLIHYGHDDFAIDYNDYSAPTWLD